MNVALNKDRARGSRAHQADPDERARVQPGAFVLMMTRTTGIVMGLVATLALTILLLPESAHRQVDRNLSAALDELRTLHSLCWLPLVDTPVLRPPPERLTQAPPSGTGCVADETLAKGTRQDALQPAEAAETARLLVEGCEDRKGNIGTSAACLVKVRPPVPWLLVAAACVWCGGIAC